MNGWRTLVLWSICAALIALIVGWPAIVVWTNANSGLASWVQAVFSVLAILATAVVVFWQHELERKRQKEADIESRRRRHSVVVAIAHATWSHAKWLRSKLPDRDTITGINDNSVYFEREDITRLGAQAGAVPLHELDDPDMLRDFLILSEHCRSLRILLMVGISDARTMNAKTFDMFFDAFDDEIAHCKTSFERLKARAGQLAAGTHVTAIS